LAIGWIESNEMTGQESVMLQNFGTGGLEEPASRPRQINETSAPGFWLLGLRSDAAGAVVAEYEALQEGGSGGIYTQAFDAAGNRLESERLVSEPRLDQ
jgi:hypothetical protein